MIDINIGLKNKEYKIGGREMWRKNINFFFLRKDKVMECKKFNFEFLSNQDKNDDYNYVFLMK